MKYECIFKQPIVRESVNPLIDKQFKDQWGPPPKTFYAGLTRLWREQHCAELNPYGSEDCPYDKEDCAVAYYRDAQTAVAQARTARGVLGLFRLLAARSGVYRADHKPLARTLYTRTDVQHYGDLPGRSPEGSLDDMADRRGSGELREVEGTRGEPSVYRPPRRPVRLGDMFRPNDVRPHPSPRRGDEGQEGSRDDGDA